MRDRFKLWRVKAEQFYARHRVWIDLAGVAIIGAPLLLVINNSSALAPSSKPYWTAVGIVVLLVGAAFNEHRHRMANPPSAVPDPTSDERRGLDELRREMRRVWVEGFLRSKIVSIGVPVELSAVLDPSKLAPDRLARELGIPESSARPARSVREEYDAANKHLLILGEPGSGKTTELLTLVDHLTSDAPDDYTPVVLNLTKWGSSGSLLNWAAKELKTYGVSFDQAFIWLKNGRLALFLDGLDEMPAGLQKTFVEALNLYLDQKTATHPIVVTCRSQEYEQLPNLPLRGAIILQPLRREQVDDYLFSGGERLCGLREVLRSDATIVSFLQSPLRLSVAVQVADSRSESELAFLYEADLRDRALWDQFVAVCLARKAVNNGWTEVEARRYLGWTAHQMTRTNSSAFDLDELSPKDLPGALAIIIPLTSLVAITGWITYLLLPYGFPANTSAIWMVVTGFTPGLVTGFTFHDLKKLPRSAWYKCFRLTFASLLIGLFISSVFLVGPNKQFSSIFQFATAGICAGVPIILGAHLAIETESARKVDAERPLQRTREALGTALIMTPVVGLAGFILDATVLKSTFPRVPPSTAASLCAIFAFSFFKGPFAIQKMVVRLILTRVGRLPKDPVAFLDWSATKGLTLRSKGTWKFYHDGLQQRLAHLYSNKGID